MGRILVVEDERVSALLMKRVLAKAGHDVVGVVSSGEEAVTTALGLRPDVIVIDMNLSGSMDGIEAIEAIENHLKASVICISGHFEDALLKKIGSTDSCSTYITKPFSEDEFIMHVETALRQKR